jgi:hypothetical protein
VIVPRREMLDAPFADLQTDFTQALEQCRHGAHRSDRGAGRRRGPRTA